MDALPLLFSAITPYFWPLYYQLFGISHVLLWQFLKTKFRGYFVGGSIILYYMRTRAWDSKMCELCELCEQLTNMPTWDNCKYATPLYFYRVNRIFFGFRAFYPQIIQKFVLPLQRNSKSSHVHRTFIALPSHTHTRVVNKRTWCFLQMQVDKELSFILFTPARFIPNPLVPAPRSYLSGGHGGNWLWV